MEWGDWFQQVAGGVIDKAASNRWTQDYEIEKLKLQQLGQYGYYTEGQPMQPVGTIGGINTNVLILGGVVLLAVMMLKD